MTFAASKSFKRAYTHDYLQVNLDSVTNKHSRYPMDEVCEVGGQPSHNTKGDDQRRALGSRDWHPAKPHHPAKDGMAEA
jgi:hypothetical protein